MLRRHQPEKQKSISKHAAKNRKYHISYAVFEIIIVGIFALFLFGWFIPTFALNTVITVTATIAILGTVLAAIIPDVGGKRSIIHGLGAYGMAICLLVMNIALLMSPEVAAPARIITIFCTIVMLIGGLIAATKFSYLSKNMLVLQSIYFLAFHIPILAATYLG